MDNACLQLDDSRNSDDTKMATEGFLRGSRNKTEMEICPSLSHPLRRPTVGVSVKLIGASIVTRDQSGRPSHEQQET